MFQLEACKVQGTRILQSNHEAGCFKIYTKDNMIGTKESPGSVRNAAKLLSITSVKSCGSGKEQSHTTSPALNVLIEYQTASCRSKSRFID